MREFDPELFERDPRYWNPKFRDFDPRMFDEMMHMMLETDEDDMSLLLLAGFIRDRMPWLAEVLLEAHRDLKGADPAKCPSGDFARGVNRLAGATT
jgi:hypothetical protein